MWKQRKKKICACKRCSLCLQIRFSSIAVDFRVNFCVIFQRNVGRGLLAINSAECGEEHSHSQSQLPPRNRHSAGLPRNHHPFRAVRVLFSSKIRFSVSVWGRNRTMRRRSVWCSSRTPRECSSSSCSLSSNGSKPARNSSPARSVFYFLIFFHDE